MLQLYITALFTQLLCTVVAVALHYLFLCVFCWMLAEGIMLYILVVKVFGKLATRWYYFLLVGWGEYTSNECVMYNG